MNISFKGAQSRYFETVLLATYKIEGNLKIVVNYDRKTPKEIIINHKVTRMVKDGED